MPPSLLFLKFPINILFSVTHFNCSSIGGGWMDNHQPSNHIDYGWTIDTSGMEEKTRQRNYKSNALCFNCKTFEIKQQQQKKRLVRTYREWNLENVADISIVSAGVQEKMRWNGQDSNWGLPLAKNHTKERLMYLTIHAKTFYCLKISQKGLLRILEKNIYWII